MTRAGRLAALVMAAATLLAACATVPETPQQGRSGMDRVSPVRSAEIHTRLGVGYFERGQLQIAMENLEVALRHDPQHTPAHVTLALIQDRLGNTRQAEHHYRQASRLAPNDGATQNAYAVFLCRQGRYEEAQTRFERAVADPFYATPEVALSNAGACALRNDRMEEAEFFLREAIALDPDFPEPLLQMAELSLMRGDLLRARAFLQRFESVGDDFPGSLRLGFMIERGLNNSPEAARYANHLESTFPDSPEAREIRSLRRDDER